MFRQMLFVVAAVALSGAAAQAADTGGAPVKMMTMGGAKMMTDARGMTLYTFDKDASGVSNCNGACAAKWPPLKADAGAKPAGDFTVIDRTDGTKQWAYDGKPLYTWVKDAKPGDTTGDGVNGVWHVAK